jgi:tetratricopeptide (TPR) repeat protein
MKPALALCLVSLCACRGPREPLPELPGIDLAAFAPGARERIGEALEAARAAPGDAERNGRLAMALHAHQRYDAALPCYRRAHLLAPREFRWLYLRALLEAAQGDSARAVSTLREAIALRRDYLPAQLKLAEVLFDAGRVDESGAEYERLAAAHPAVAEPHYGLGRVRTARGDAAGAAEAYRKACDIFPAYGAAHYALALAYRKLGDPRSERHLDLYEKFRMGAPPSEDALAAELRAMGSAATDLIRQAIELDARGRLAESVELHLKALVSDPQVDQAHVNLISLYGRLGQAAKAEEHYRAAVAMNPNLAEAHYNFGVFCFGQKRLKEAKAAFAEALKINPNHPDANNNYAFLLESEGRVDEAVPYYEKAVSIKPDLRLAHFHLGRILANRRQYTRAIAHLEKTVHPADESTPGFLYALGAAWGRAGDRKRAVEYLRQARAGAASYNQTQLVASIDRDLRSLGATAQ